MSERIERTEEIVEAIRKETCGGDGIFYSMDGRKVLAYAERFKRAARHERDVAQGQIDHADAMAFCVSCERFVRRPTGNLEKMQEALWEICDYANGVYGGDMSDDLRRAIRDKARAALAATLRNCDRGREAAEDAFTAEFGRPWTEEEARVAAWLFEEAGRTGTPRQDADGRAT